MNGRTDRMAGDKIAKRVEKLRAIINEHRYRYNVLNQSDMSEAAADSLKHELSQLEEKYPRLVTEDSPTQRVAGRALPGFTQIRHSSRMLSLNDVFNEEELAAWFKRVTKLVPDWQPEFFMDIKMDGLACALVYEDGVLAKAITRGDGFVGEDVTANVRTIESVPLRLRSHKGYEKFLAGRTEVRGEIVMYKEQFAALNDGRAKKGLPKFANPRNLAAGTIRQLDPKLVAARPLQFHAYDLLRESPDDVPTNEYAYEALRSIGLRANAMSQLTKTLKGIMRFAEHWEEARQQLPFNTDGLVVKVNDRHVFARLGIVGKAPRGAVAYKYPAEQATTKVRDIFVSIGRTGSATPVALLEPVVVAGSTVQMATLHNESEVARKDIRVGDTVIVQKAGDIIPEVVEPLVKLRTGAEKPFKMPAHCPDCNTKLIKAKETEAVWRCPNNACPSRAWKQIQHYASRPAVDIDGMGEKNVQTLLEAGLIKDAADMYTLQKGQLLKLDRFAEVSAGKLVKAIQEKKNPSLPRFIYGLGIRHIGTQTAIDLATHFHTLQKLADAKIDELARVEGIGEVVAKSVAEWFGQPQNRSLLAKFKDVGVEPESAQPGKGPLTGMNIVVTGGLDTMSREEAAERIRAAGGTFQSSVGKETDFLVVGANVGASKRAKAEKLGTKQIDEERLLKMLEAG